MAFCHLSVWSDIRLGDKRRRPSKKLLCVRINMSNVLILKVEDVLDVSGRGIVLVPGLETELYNFSGEYEAIIETPNGVQKNCKVSFTIPFQSPPPNIRKFWCHLLGLSKLEIPIGSNLWLINAGKVSK
jgi:hypothetical protein